MARIMVEKPMGLYSMLGLSVVMMASLLNFLKQEKMSWSLSTAKDTRIGVSVEIDDYNFEVVKDFVYLQGVIQKFQYV